jgi:hypothetical protein
MSVAISTASNRTTIRPVPKPKDAKVRRGGRPGVEGIAARRLALAQGHAFADIAADLDAAGHAEVAHEIDRARFDPLLRDAVRIATGVLALPNLPREARMLMTALRGNLVELVRLDDIKDEHHLASRAYIERSIDAGRAVVAVHQSLLSPADSEGEASDGR